METDLVKIATVGDISAIFDTYPIEPGLVQALLVENGYDLETERISHFLIHSRSALPVQFHQGKMPNIAQFSQLDLVSPGVTQYRSRQNYTELEVADNAVGECVRMYKSGIPKSEFQEPYYAITTPESYQRLSEIFLSERFAVEKLQSREPIVTPAHSRPH